MMPAWPDPGRRPLIQFHPVVTTVRSEGRGRAKYRTPYRPVGRSRSGHGCRWPHWAGGSLPGAESQECDHGA
eukprot:501975-Hanusia_phi.AAC.2